MKKKVKSFEICLIGYENKKFQACICKNIHAFMYMKKIGIQTLGFRGLRVQEGSYNRRFRQKLRKLQKKGLNFQQGPNPHLDSL